MVFVWKGWRCAGTITGVEVGLDGWALEEMWLAIVYCTVFEV